MDKETKQEFENLARMIKNGFDETAQKADVDRHFDDVNKRFGDIDLQLHEIRRDVAEISKNIVYRDEFDKFTLEFNDLMARVKYLEQKIGVESGK